MTSQHAIASTAHERGVRAVANLLIARDYDRQLLSSRHLDDRMLDSTRDAYLALAREMVSGYTDAVGVRLPRQALTGNSAVEPKPSPSRTP